jgi:hypothetical protein
VGGSVEYKRISEFRDLGNRTGYVMGYRVADITVIERLLSH